MRYCVTMNGEAFYIEADNSTCAVNKLLKWLEYNHREPMIKTITVVDLTMVTKE